MGTLDEVLNSTVELGTATFIVIAILLGVLTLPVMTAVTKFAAMSVVFAVVIDDMVLTNRPFDALSLLSGIAAAGGVKVLL